ncbi:MAG: type II secretion system F family protein [Chloroflexi bacterium]|nr:type II secretion system F family protein [Chloroflexota bacterium]
MHLPDLSVILLAGTWSLVAAFATAFVLRRRRRKAVRSRLVALHIGGLRPQPVSSARPRLYFNAAKFTAIVARRAPKLVERLQHQIDGSDQLGKLTWVRLLSLQTAFAGCGSLVGVVLMLNLGARGIAVVMLLGALGWFAPTLWLAQRRRARVRQMTRDLPTVIDLLSLSLQAGMGLDRAIRVVSERVESPLSDELRRVLGDISLGLSRRESFTRLSDRLQSDDIRLLTTSIVQSEQLGTSLVGTIKTQSHQLRVSRRRAAEAAALKAPIKMLVPMVLFILPALFLVVLGPAGINVGLALTGGGHP